MDQCYNYLTEWYPEYSRFEFHAFQRDQYHFLKILKYESESFSKTTWIILKTFQKPV